MIHIGDIAVSTSNISKYMYMYSVVSPYNPAEVDTINRTWTSNVPCTFCYLTIFIFTSYFMLHVLPFDSLCLLPVSNSYRILSLLSWFFTPTCISLINILLTHPLLSLSTQFLTNPLILSLLFITLYFSVIFNHDCNSPYSILSLSQFLTHPVPVFSLLAITLFDSPCSFSAACFWLLYIRSYRATSWVFSGW